MNYQTKAVVCPFYKNDGKKSIKCEGSITPMCEQHFSSAVQKGAYFTVFCCCEYKRCGHAKNVEGKYKKG